MVLLLEYPMGYSMEHPVGCLVFHGIYHGISHGTFDVPYEHPIQMGRPMGHSIGILWRLWDIPWTVGGDISWGVFHAMGQSMRHSVEHLIGCRHLILKTSCRIYGVTWAIPWGIPWNSLCDTRVSPMGLLVCRISRGTSCGIFHGVIARHWDVL